MQKIGRRDIRYIFYSSFFIAKRLELQCFNIIYTIIFGLRTLKIITSHSVEITISNTYVTTTHALFLYFISYI